MLKQLVWALVLSAPLAIISFAVAEKTHLPEIARLVFSPGQVIVLRLPPRPPGETLDEAIHRMMSAAITINMVYYLLILFALLTARRRIRAR